MGEGGKGRRRLKSALQTRQVRNQLRGNEILARKFNVHTSICGTFHLGSLGGGGGDGSGGRMDGYKTRQKSTNF